MQGGLQALGAADGHGVGHLLLLLAQRRARRAQLGRRARELPLQLAVLRAQLRQLILYLPISPYISLHLPTSPYTSLHLRAQLGQLVLRRFGQRRRGRRAAA